MSHPDEGVLQEWLDGELAGEALKAVEAHVASCAACGTRLDEMRATMAMADGLVGSLRVPDDGVGRRDGGTAGRQETAGRRVTAGRLGFRVSRGHMGIAAGLLVAVTAGLLLRGRSVTPPQLDRAPVVEGQGGMTVPTSQAAAPAPAPTTPAAAANPAPAERVNGDTFRLRAGLDRPEVAARTGNADVAGKAVAAGEAAKVETTSKAPVAAIAEAPRPAAAAASQAAPPSAQRLEHSVVLRPRRIGALVPVHMDTLPGAFRSTYEVGGTTVVLDESVRPLPPVSRQADQAARQASPDSAYDWELHGAHLRLRGALGQDSLVALSRLVR